VSTDCLSEWEKACNAAFSERDPEKIFQRVIVAETAIFHRLHDDVTSTPETNELEAIANILKNLRRLVANTFHPS
jgi:hypothetical protein